MLSVSGNSAPTLGRATRREALRLGGLGAFGLGLDSLLAGRESSATPAGDERSFGRAKSCILLFPYGSPPQHETFDPKPTAPVEIRGELGAIETSVPGISICDHLPRVAQVMDRVTVVRSMTHPYPLHCVCYSTSGIPEYDVSLETRPRDVRQWPFLGSVVGYAREQQRGLLPAEMPNNVGLPWLLNSRSDIVPLAGPYAAFLGQQYDPFWPTYQGGGTRTAPKLSDGQSKLVQDPYAGCTADGRFVLSETGPGADTMTPDRLNQRRHLLEQFDDVRRGLDLNSRLRTYDRHRQTAWSVLTSDRLRGALDLSREPVSVRDRYGMTLFGQSCLAARRLVEAGCPFITVFWDAYEIFAGCAWDTHANHFPRLKEYLLPGMDLAYSALILDLEERGLLSETLVLWMSEHGRTPQIDSKPIGAGRHHWSRAYSGAVAGGGTAGGQVVGRTDAQGGDVEETPMSPKDLLATSLHLLGIDPHLTVPGIDGRPHPVSGTGIVRPELFA